MKIYFCEASGERVTDKDIEGLNLVSPLSGTVKAINRGAKRTLMTTKTN